MKEKIFVALSTFANHGEEPLRLLNESGFPYVLNSLGRRLKDKEIVGMGKNCHGVIAGVEPYNEYVLDNMPLLRCISRCGVGIDNIALEKATQKGIEIRNTPDVIVQPVAELTIGMVFNLLRRISWHTRLLKSRRWEKKTGGLLVGKSVGVLGLGRVGKRVAEMMAKFDTQVFGADINPDYNWASSNQIKIVSTEELIRTCDILCLHLSVSKEHPFQLGEKEISNMKKGALVVNVSRGELVDENALYRALKDEYLGGVAMDVFTKEPYMGRLCDLDNVVLTPHIATLTKESRLQMEIEATQNLINFLNPKA